MKGRDLVVKQILEIEGGKWVYCNFEMSGIRRLSDELLDLLDDSNES